MYQCINVSMYQCINVSMYQCINIVKARNNSVFPMNRKSDLIYLSDFPHIDLSLILTK